jgi:Dolichyl-phosphate-mannose-protein mannosyltransferase
MVRALRRSGLVLALPALVGTSTVLLWLAGRRLTGLWIMPDEAVYAERAIALWRHGRLAILHGDGAGYGFLYPVLAGAPLSSGRLATGYASLKLLQALAMSLVAVPVFFYGRRIMRPGYALLAAALALASPLTLYAGFVMTEVLIYPIGAFALLAIARAVETATLQHQAIAVAAIAAALLTRVQSIVLVAVFATAIVVDWLLSRERRPLRAFWPVWSLLLLGGLVIVATPGLFGAYAGTLRGHYPLRSALALVGEHFSYIVFSTAVAPAVALALLLVSVARGVERQPAVRAVVSVASCATILVVLQVGFFAARYAPHLLGRDLALLPPLLFTVFALWLDRGAPRPRAALFFVVLSTLALLLLSPWNDLVNVGALPDTFDIEILYHLGSDHAAAVVAAVSLAILTAVVLLRGRLLPVLPLTMLVLLIGSSAVASNDLARRVNYDQRNLVGVPPDWIARVTHAPTAYLYDDEAYWNGVWQARFWNRNISDVVAIAPARVPGPMSQRVIHVPADGRLPIDERYVVASDPHSFAGTPVGHLAQSGLDTAGLTLWQLSGPARLTTIERGIRPNGDMVEPGFVRAYDCAGGRLEMTLLPKNTAVVTLKLDGRVTTREKIAGLQYWNGTISVPPSPTPRVCHFEIDGQTLLGSTRIEFVHR